MPCAMTSYPFTLADADLIALPSGALHWPTQQTLCVSDLHLGKSGRMARRGGSLLPPYEVRATLEKLDADIETTRPARVICLGDSFDDLSAVGELEDHARLWLARLMAGRDWVWIEGNHDAGPVEIGGSHRAELHLGPLTFRHIATPAVAELSGHYHPKARLGGTARPCFLLDADRLILPAYGHYTGGLRCEDPVLQAIMRPQALAILTGPRAIPMPMPRG
jgi:DNA ligase-associated metallophosphoesterase